MFSFVPHPGAVELLLTVNQSLLTPSAAFKPEFMSYAATGNHRHPRPEIKA